MSQKIVMFIVIAMKDLKFYIYKTVFWDWDCIGMPFVIWNKQAVLMSVSIHKPMTIFLHDSDP
jgi:hypothetical protein